jgi:large subunit ribosomal protein L23
MLIKPLITEKSMRLAQSGQFTFAVLKTASKTQIKALVETTFKVKVLKVRVLSDAGKSRRSGKKGFTMTTPARIKAIVALQAGQMIEYFELPKEKNKKVKK